MTSESNASPNAVAEAYISGTRTRNVDLLKSICLDGAIMTGWLGPDLLHGAFEPFYDALEANEVGDDYSAIVDSVVVVDKIANATITESNLLGMSFENHFQIIQTANGDWFISAKLFRHF